MGTGARIQLTRFLNQIDFTYIPAIKDLEVFGDLIQRMYDAAAQSAGLQRATAQFVEAIRNQTGELSSRLSEVFSNKTQLAAPTEMGLLFRSLDFTHGDDSHSLLKQKGDGIKARHLPELLKFINAYEANKKYFIWGFEEPENSLDFGAAESEARNFAQISSRSDTQIFITSHSPAFYLTEADSRSHKIKRLFISKQVASPDGTVSPKNALSSIDSLDDAEHRMKESSLLQLPFLIRKWKEIKDETSKLNLEMSELRTQIERIKKPTIYVEGKTDKIVFDKILESDLAQGQSVDIRVLDGTPRSTAELLVKIGPTGGLGAAPVLFLFDNDRAGRAAYFNICKSKAPGPAPTEAAKNIFVWALPATDEISKFFKTYQISQEFQKVTLEFIFPGHESAEMCLNLIRRSGLDTYNKTIHNDYHETLSQLQSQKLRDTEPGKAEWLWSRGVPDDLKVAFVRRALTDLDRTHASTVLSTALATLRS